MFDTFDDSLKCMFDHNKIKIVVNVMVWCFELVAVSCMAVGRNHDCLSV